MALSIDVEGVSLDILALVSIKGSLMKVMRSSKNLLSGERNPHMLCGKIQFFTLEDHFENLP